MPEKFFQEKTYGAQRDRPELKAALAYMRKGDTLVVWKLSRFARGNCMLEVVHLLHYSSFIG
jgi:DNA invertase Pin-like site-specific DNA recombinase